MRRKNEFLLYTCMWVTAIAVLMALLLQNLGDARIVNYSGIVRGATQKLVKEELGGEPDDILIAKIDGIIDNLQTGKGEFDLRRNSDKTYQKELTELKAIWGMIKKEIYRVRSGSADGEALFQLSQQHFESANRMVSLAEQTSDNKLLRFIVVYAVVLLLSVFVFTLLNRRNNRALEKSIYTDNLTGILNRAGFEETASSLLRQRGKAGYCLMEFDIDDFKFFNNSYGYEVGDQLLCALADSLQTEFHTDELCARISADDFVVLAKQGADNVEKLRGLLATTIAREPFRDLSGFVTFALGGYEIPETSEMIQSIMDKANMAHKNAKGLGKAMIVWYDVALLEKLNQENRLKNRMRQSLEAGEFKLYLQPKVRISNLELHGAEALVRWDYPNDGLIPPDHFIPLFEKNGQIADLDFYMLEKACAYIRRYLETTGEEFCISVNFSRVTIYQQRFYSSLLETVDRFQIPRRCIEIEITESAFNEITEGMTEKLLQLQQAGFVISMDDFGSGYSSLNSLDKLSIQILKLDRDFLREYSRSPRVKSVVACVVELAHRLDVQVVCEGVETEAQLEFLKTLGCDYGQGYYFARPMPEENFYQKYHVRKLPEPISAAVR